MSNEPKYPSFDGLKQAVERIDKIMRRYGEIDLAMSLPDKYAHTAESVHVSSWHRSVAEAAKAVQERFVLEERRRGEIERDVRLSGLSDELDIIRGALVSLAASATIEIGQVARELRETLSA